MAKIWLAFFFFFFSPVYVPAASPDRPDAPLPDPGPDPPPGADEDESGAAKVGPAEQLHPAPASPRRPLPATEGATAQISQVNLAGPKNVFLGMRPRGGAREEEDAPADLVGLQQRICTTTEAFGKVYVLLYVCVHPTNVASDGLS